MSIIFSLPLATCISAPPFTSPITFKSNNSTILPLCGWKRNIGNNYVGVTAHAAMYSPDSVSVFLPSQYSVSESLWEPVPDSDDDSEDEDEDEFYHRPWQQLKNDNKQEEEEEEEEEKEKEKEKEKEEKEEEEEKKEKEKEKQKEKEKEKEKEEKEEEEKKEKEEKQKEEEKRKKEKEEKEEEKKEYGDYKQRLSRFAIPTSSGWSHLSLPLSEIHLLTTTQLLSDCDNKCYLESLDCLMNIVLKD